MSGQGTATLDFGSFPGGSDASVAVSAPSILSTSLAEAWLFPVDTIDHLADEHRVETLSVMAGSVVAGVGFTIYGQNTSQLNEPTSQSMGNRALAGYGGGTGTRIYGKWNVAWVYN